VKPRKRRRTSFAGSALSQHSPDGDSPPRFCEPWPDEEVPGVEAPSFADQAVYECETNSSYHLPVEGDDVEEILRTEPPTSSMRSTFQSSDLAMVHAPLVASPLFEFNAPAFEEFTNQKNRRALVDHFCNVLSHLIVFQEDTGNPFRQLVLPLSHTSSPIMNAIFALSSAHLEYRGIENEEKSLDFHNKALQGLAQQIEQNEESSKEEVLGAIMLLVYYEVVSLFLPSGH
jgi:hypothetical protein